MKEIHERKLYDTDTAIKVAYGYDEFCYKKTLYKTKKGNFFCLSEMTVLGLVAGSGGLESVSTDYAASIYNGLNNKICTYKEVFGDIPEA